MLGSTAVNPLEPCVWHTQATLTSLSLSLCAGAWNVTVRHLEQHNATAEAHVAPGASAGNFTLDCQRGHATYVAGERVVCRIVTLDSCDNPTATPPTQSASWAVTRTGAALEDGDTVLPVYESDDHASAAAANVLAQDGLGTGGALLTSRYQVRIHRPASAPREIRESSYAPSRPAFPR